MPKAHGRRCALTSPPRPKSTPPWRTLSAQGAAPLPSRDQHNVSDQINDLIVRGRVATLDADRRVIDDGAVVVRDGTIVAVGPWAAIERQHKAKRVMGRASAIVLPGFIDTHTHCSQCFVRTLTTGELPMIP